MKLIDINVHFGAQRVLDHFSLELPDTGRLALMGPSGCGKSTLLRVLCALQPYTGRIEGLAQRRVGLLFQDERLLPWLSAQDNVAAALADELSKEQRATKARALLEQCGLEHGAFDKVPSELSGGMKKRVAIARLLALESDVWLLDESFRGLEERSRDELLALMAAQSGQRLVLLVTHDEREASALCQRILRFEGPPLRER